MKAVKDLHRLLKLKSTLKKYPDSSYGGSSVINEITKKIRKSSDAAINARGSLSGFRRVRGRVISIFKKVS